jgi:hypothetical protein
MKVATRTLFKYTVTSADDIRRMAGVSGTIPVGNANEKNAKLAEDLKKGGESLVKENGKAVAAPRNPEYAVEVLVQRGGKGPFEPLDVIVPGGQPKEGVIAGTPRVDLQPTDRYAIKVANNSPLGAGVEIEIDGINLFEMCDDIPAWKKLGKMYFHPGQSATITGWYVCQKGKQETKRFTVVSTEESLAKKLGRPASSAGFITVRFCAAWNDTEKPPADEEKFSRSLVGTMPGEVDAKSGFQAAETPKVFGVLRSQVSVQYSRPADLPQGLDAAVEGLGLEGAAQR